MYTLYMSPGTASLCVHWMLIELGEPHELKKLDLEAGDHRKPAYLKLNPNGFVPTLIAVGVPPYRAPAPLLLPVPSPRPNASSSCTPTMPAVGPMISS